VVEALVELVFDLLLRGASPCDEGILDGGQDDGSALPCAIITGAGIGPSGVFSARR